MLVTKDLKIPGYERVVRGWNNTTGLDALIAIHNTRLGPALGGIRFKEYESPEEQCVDAMRLAEAMSLKNSLCGINKGGGKSTINALGITKTPELYESFGEFVESLDGLYLAAGDFGTTTEDLIEVQKATRHVGGIKFDSSKYTAMGVANAIIAWKSIVAPQVDPSAFYVAISGLGKVGYKLALLLAEQGFNLYVADITSAPHKLVDEIGQKTRVYVGNHEDIHETMCDVFSPCALGGIINYETREDLGCRAIIGAANNQVDNLDTVQWLHDNNIDYITDYLVNAGGVIAIDNEVSGDCNESTIERKTHDIFVRTNNLMVSKKATGRSFDFEAQRAARQRINNAHVC